MDWNTAISKYRDQMQTAGWLNLHGADLSGANLRGVDLRGADLSGADLHEADLSEADLSGANLSGADLRWADLGGANLSEANLRGADLRWASLCGADLHRANLRGAALHGADLDLSCIPLCCGGLGWKVDTRLVYQVLYHVLSWETGNVELIKRLAPLLDLANKMHRADVPRLTEVK